MVVCKSHKLPSTQKTVWEWLTSQSRQYSSTTDHLTNTHLKEWTPALPLLLLCLILSLPILFPLFAPPAGPECSKNFTSNSGVIKSPGFPEKYPNNLDCTFMIFAPKMSEIILEFESFELEPDATPPAGVFCRYDRLEIWDGFPGGELTESSVGLDWVWSVLPVRWSKSGIHKQQNVPLCTQGDMTNFRWILRYNWYYWISWND